MASTRRTGWRLWLREPALHFGLLGLLLFALYRWVAPEPNPEPEPNVIVVSAATTGALERAHERRTGRAPSAAELDALVARYVEDEVLFREGVALGLHRGDPIIRRRLIQKMTFVSEDLTPLPEPSEEVLAAYLEQHGDAYSREARVAFRHVFVGRDGTAAGSDASGNDLAVARPDRAEGLLQRLANGEAAAGLGDPFLHGLHFSDITAARLDRLFGPGVAEAVLAAPIGVWSGPIESSYGQHLVYVEAIEPAGPATLDEVRDRVRRDWLADQRERANREVLRRLVSGYEVRREDAP